MGTIHANQKVHSLFNTLRLTYGLVPIVAGLDKFTNLLTDWEQYLSPAMVSLLPFSATTFMMLVGVIEIIAGLIVLSMPVIGGYIVMAWLSLIALTLIASGTYLDVAVRDLVMAIGSYSFVQIARMALSMRPDRTHHEIAFP